MSETNTPTNDPTPNEGMQPDGAQQDNQPEGQGDGKQEPEKKYGDWRDQRIARFERQRNEERQARAAAEDRARQLEERLQAFERQQRGNAPQDNQRPPQPDVEAVRAQERQRVETEARERDFNAKCNAVAQKITATLGQSALDTAADNWKRVGISEPAGRTLLEDLVSFDHAAEMYHHIGTDPDLAAHLLGLNDRERYAELRDIARAQPWTGSEQPTQGQAPAAAPRQVSQAPRPMGRQPGPARQSSKSVYDNGLSMDDFVALRSKKS